jgi:hypothetical protein
MAQLASGVRSLTIRFKVEILTFTKIEIYKPEGNVSALDFQRIDGSAHDHPFLDWSLMF